jgi:hypothetical protein
MKYREMQKLLKYKGLNAKGSIEELEARLAEANKEPMKLEPVDVKKKQTGSNSFVFTGYGAMRPAVINKWGYRFDLDGDAVVVDDAEIASRLRLHPHFKEV